jgi:hypothetical protein
LYAAYATTVVWFGALLVSLVFLGSTRLAAASGALLVVGLLLAFIRDKRRKDTAHANTGSSVTNEQDTVVSGGRPLSWTVTGVE